jgi:hypothetical protein
MIVLVVVGVKFKRGSSHTWHSQDTQEVHRDRQELPIKPNMLTLIDYCIYTSKLARYNIIVLMHYLLI